MRHTFLIVLLISGLLSGVVVADQLFVGTGDFNPDVSDNDGYLIDVPGGATTSVTSIDVWGATSNGGSTVFLSSNVGTSAATVADNLYAFDVGSGSLTELGVVTVGGTATRLDGLAYSGGTLYGWTQFDVGDNSAGLYSIDLTTLEATAAFIPVDATNISGIDADPTTGLIYGADDGLGQIVQIDVGAQSITNVADYTGSETDIDGLAVGGGNIYLVPDDNTPGFADVYNIASGTYTGTVNVPFGADTFSGAAYVNNVNNVPEPSSAVCLMALCGVIASRRKRRA